MLFSWLSALARRQLIVKTDSSTSWFVGIKHLHRKYELKEAISYLDEPESKTKWTRTCNNVFRIVSKQRHPRMKCPIVSSFSLHSKQVASVSVLYIRILLLCSISAQLAEILTRRLIFQLHITIQYNIFIPIRVPQGAITNIHS
jgi:hypothetical protein